MTPSLIASPYPDGHVIVSPGRDGGIKVGTNRYAELRDASDAAPMPSWLAAAALERWRVDLAGHVVKEAVLVRPDTAYGYARASYELNLGCNYDCEHCYLPPAFMVILGWACRDREKCP